MNIPLDLDNSELTVEVRERLRTVLRDYACPPTPEGWRKLALMLLSLQHSAFQSGKGQLGGVNNYGALLWMEKHLREKPEMRAIDAAKAVARQLNADKRRRRKVSSKTLQNQFAVLKDRKSSKLTVPRALQRYEALWNALTSAALKLEQTYQDEPYYDEPSRVVK